MNTEDRAKALKEAGYNSIEAVKNLLKCKTKKGKTGEYESDEPLNIIENYSIILDNDLAISGCFQYNELSQRREFKNPETGYIEIWEDRHDSFLRQYIESQYGIKNKDNLNDAINLKFTRCKYHPIRDFLNSLKWDGKERVSSMLQTYLGAEDCAYTKEVARLMMVGAVARVLHPGCKFDYMPVLIGKAQGEGKSTFVQRLAMCDDWYREITTVDGDKGVEALRGGWICEMGELLALKRSKDVEAVKSYITRTADNYRTPYDKYPQQLPRQCIIIGTTNIEAFLTDKTGNRRYLPIDVKGAKDKLFSDTETVHYDFEQCWAEAVQLYQDGSPLISNPEMEQEISERQHASMEDDYRIGMIRKYLEETLGDKVCAKELWDYALGQKETRKELDKRTSMEIGLIMQSMEGWEKRKAVYRSKEYGAQRGWERTEPKDISKMDGVEEITDEQIELPY